MRTARGAVKGWADSVGEDDNGGDKLNLKDLLFFLHIPRTGGRTYFHCFLKNLYTNAQECPRSYDKLVLVSLQVAEIFLNLTRCSFSSVPDRNNANRVYPFQQQAQYFPAISPSC